MEGTQVGTTHIKRCCSQEAVLPEPRDGDSLIHASSIY